MLDFYGVNIEYANYLRQIDSKVPNIQYVNRNKFICGVVLKINNMDYYVPVSSKKYVDELNMPIVAGEKVLGTLRFGYMFPVPIKQIETMRINDIKDFGYKKLVLKEYTFIKRNEKNIENFAKKAYSIGCQKYHILNAFCCDFKKLEQACEKYEQSQKLSNSFSIAEAVKGKIKSKEEDEQER